MTLDVTLASALDVAEVLALRDAEIKRQQI